MIVDKEQLNPYLEQDSDLITLNVWNKQTTDKKGKVQVRGKTPLYPNWTNSEKNINKTLKMADKSFNVGYRLGPHDLIIDVDERNYKEGKDSLQLLCKFLGVDDLGDTCPTVITGSGGFHYYMVKPKGELIRETIEQFPGIEFKTMGRQVVAAGSKHPNGTYYVWDDFAPALSERPDAPTKLIKLLHYKAPEKQANSGTINGDQLARLLEQLPITDYTDNGQWFPILCAAHHGTDGEGIEEFLDWSLADSSFSEDEHLIRCRWASLGEKPKQTTVLSLYKEVLSHGGTTAVVTANEDFKDFSDDEGDCDGTNKHNNDEPNDNDNSYRGHNRTNIRDNIPGDDGYMVDDDFSDVYTEPDVKGSYKEGLALDLANGLYPTATEEEIIVAIRAAIQSGTIEKVKALDTIRTKLGWTKGQLTEVIKQIQERIAEDLGRMLAEKTLNIKFHKGRGLVLSTSNQFWKYNGTHWIIVTRSFVGKMVTQVLDAMRDKVDINVKETSIVNEAVSILERLVAVDNDMLNLRGRPNPVVNCLNGELWIADDGTAKMRKHRPESNLIQVLETKYSPGSECPLFDKSVREIFSRFKDCEDMVRHFEEYMGFVLHPDKRPAKWWLFKGPGGDGKTTLLKIMCGMLGDAVLPESIAKFGDAKGSDNHATANVVGKLLVYDDDLSRNTLLPDGPLKQLSESGEMTANPKGTPAFRFRKSCAVTLLSNGYPKTKDLSEGFRRRAMVIPFDRSFHKEDSVILDLAEQIIDREISGVLNRALQGLQRLRTRGDFKEPKSCEMARETWLSESNTVALFKREHIIQTDDHMDKISLSDVYSAYSYWCVDYGINNVCTKQQLRTTLEDLDLNYGKLAGNKSGFRGVTLVPNEVSDFDGVNEGANSDDDWDL